MSKQSVWIVTGALGIVGLGAGVASAASDVGGDGSLDESPAVQVSSFDIPSTETPNALPVDITLTLSTSITAVTAVSAVSPMSVVSAMSVQSTVSPPSVQSAVSAMSAQSTVSPPSVQSTVSAESSD